MFIHDGGQIRIGDVNALLTITTGANSKQVFLEEDPLDIVCLTTNPWPTAQQQPLGLALLYPGRMELYDMHAETLSPVQPEHGLDFHSSLTTAVSVVSNCDATLFAALTWAKSQLPVSSRPWLLTGGTVSLLERNGWTLVITGHADGVVRFWHTNAGSRCSLVRAVSSSLIEQSHLFTLT
jgi:hypothetical protein